MQYENAMVSKLISNACRIKFGLTKKVMWNAVLKMVHFAAHLNNTSRIQQQSTTLILPLLSQKLMNRSLKSETSRLQPS